MPDPHLSIGAAPLQISRKCEECKQEEKTKTLQTKLAAPSNAAGSEAPGDVHEVLRSPGQPLDAATRAYFEPRFGHNFSAVRNYADRRFGMDLRQVRLHEGASAARSARAVNARAYTVGQDIVFADRIDTASHSGRLLLAHELAHTVQQAGGATAGPKLQRQIPTPTEQEDMKDPDCPPEAPYRWGPKRGPGTADPAVVSPCMATPMPHPQQNPLTPDQTPPQQAAPPEPAPAPTSTPEASPTTAPSAPAPAPAAADQPAAETDDVDTRFEDDPLSEEGFGPDDTTIRVRPGPVRTTLIRPSGADLSCSYEMRQIASFPGLPGTGDIAKLAADITKAFTGCPIAYVTIDVVSNPNDDDPDQTAIERAETVMQELMQATGYSYDRFYTGLSSALSDPEITILLGGRNPLGSSAGSPEGGRAPTPVTPVTAPTPEEHEQVSVQAGVGDVRHFYTTPAGPNDALHEWLNQFVAAYTAQHHGKDESGTELQISATVQYSLTTHQMTVLVGGQVLYVWQLPAKFQLSFWAQLQAGENVSATSTQEQLAAGTRLTWQPKDWLALGAQVGVGPTVQSSGPNSIDRSAVFFFQIQK